MSYSLLLKIRLCAITFPMIFSYQINETLIFVSVYSICFVECIKDRMLLNTSVFIILRHELQFLALFNVYPASFIYTDGMAQVVTA
jgi:hypothetical protein